VNYSLRGVGIEPGTSGWRKRPSPRSLPARTGTGGSTKGRVLARSDRPGPIELLSARYPVIRRLVGELSFRIAARRFIRSHPPSGVVPDSFSDNFPDFIRDLGNAACIEYVADVAQPGGYAFLCALTAGKTMATAAEIATEVASRFDVVCGLRLIEDAKVVVGIQRAR
jgi:Putative DNA-binding domain